jgi:hypothetical protein
MIFYLTPLMSCLDSSALENNSHFSTYNNDYRLKMLKLGKAVQETPWGFQEISLKDTIEHNVSSIDEYKSTLSGKTTLTSQGLGWKDNKVHIINFAEGNYSIPHPSNTYYVLLVPSKTIIQGAGIGKTIFKAESEIILNDSFRFRKLFNLEYATHDVVLRDISFYNETKDNKWGLIHSNGNYNRENYLFENIEFDDVFGAIGKTGYLSSFITLRGLRKRIGNTTQRINQHFTVPVPSNYQFAWTSTNTEQIELAGQIGVRDGNSVVFHDCILGDNISATIDIYSNYIEIVGVDFIDPLYDHSIKSPNANHLYIHDSTFDLTYTHKIIDNSYWNPTFFSHEGGTLINYHFKNLNFKRAGKVFNKTVEFVESEPFMLYDNRPENVSGDLVWENISFQGYTTEHQVLGYSNVQTDKGYEAINYTNFQTLPAQLKQNNNNSRGNFDINVTQSDKSSKQEIKGVYSWGQNKYGMIDYPRDNRLFSGNKQNAYTQPYILMQYSTVKNTYNSLLQEN